MAMLLARNGNLYILDCYDEYKKVQQLGACWDARKKTWYMAFTPYNVEKMLDCLKDPIIESSVEEYLLKEKQKQKELNKIKEAAKIDQPVKLHIPGIKLPLFNYQKLGIMFAMANGECVLIADSMGLGKSLENIGLSCLLKSQEKANNCLIIVPAAVKWNWPLEIEKFTNNIPYVVIDGSPEERINQWLGNFVCRRLKNGKYVYETGTPFFTIVNYDLIMEDLFGGRNIKIKSTDSMEIKEKKKKQAENYALRMAKLEKIREKIFDIICLDEIHYIKNHSSSRTRCVKKLKGNFRVGLTGTPLDGKLEELHSVMEFIKPGLFPSKMRFLQKHANFDYFGKVIKYKRINEVRENIQPYFIRRMKEDVLKELPEKTYKNVYIELSTKERSIYKSIAKGKHPSSEDALAMTKVIRCKQLCDHPNLVGENNIESSKLNSLMEILEELIKYNGQKIIVFSQYKEMLDIIDDKMKLNKYKFLRIDGDVSPKRRADMQSEFNDDPSIDAIIGTEAMSTGLNLTGASYVINYDDNWAPAIMRQREDRAYRQGQKNAVTVINFIVKDTIEERIRDMIYNKESISVEVLGDNTEETILKRLSPEEIATLI